MQESTHINEAHPPLTELRKTELWAGAFGLGTSAVRATVEKLAAPVFSELSLAEQTTIRTERRHTYFA